MVTGAAICPNCKGTGSVYLADDCGVCGGEGVVDGITLDCTDCGVEVLLPFVNGDQQRVVIGPMQDWTSPPRRCPKCSAHHKQLVHEAAIDMVADMYGGASG